MESSAAEWMVPHNVTDYDHEMHLLLLSKSRVKSSIGTSTLMAGFALVAMVEAELSNDTPTGILIPFTMVTALLICVHLFSLVIATRLLPELEAIVSKPQFLFTSSISHGHTWPVQVVWYLSNIVGIFLFLVELVFVAFVKFYPHKNTNYDRFYIGIATLSVVIIFSVIATPFIVIFFRSVSNKKVQLIEQRLERGRALLDNLNQTNQNRPVNKRSVSTSNEDLTPYARPIDTQV